MLHRAARCPNAPNHTRMSKGALKLKCKGVGELLFRLCFASRSTLQSCGRNYYNYQPPPVSWTVFRSRAAPANSVQSRKRCLSAALRMLVSSSNNSSDEELALQNLKGSE
eukprot:6198439-Pleurochrysis_carterae.AAC.1